MNDKEKEDYEKRKEVAFKEYQRIQRRILKNEI